MNFTLYVYLKPKGRLSIILFKGFKGSIALWLRVEGLGCLEAKAALNTKPETLNPNPRP